MQSGIFEAIEPTKEFGSFERTPNYMEELKKQVADESGKAVMESASRNLQKIGYRGIQEAGFV